MGGCRDTGHAARSEDLLDPTVWTGSDVRVNPDVTAVASDAAHVSGGASLATCTHDSSSVACVSNSVVRCKVAPSARLQDLLDPADLY